MGESSNAVLMSCDWSGSGVAHVVMARKSHARRDEACMIDNVRLSWCGEESRSSDAIASKNKDTLRHAGHFTLISQSAAVH
jgi:hypothetical protein